MMICKVCATPLGDAELTCPNCGYVASPKGREGGRVKERAAGSARAAAPSKERLRLESGKAGRPKVRVGLEEGEGAKEDQQGPDASTPAFATTEAPLVWGAHGQKGSDASTPAFALDPVGLRELLARQPELLEEGLSILTDEKGRPIGAGYSTGVGDIDLLARDTSGAFVVVMVAEPWQGEELMAETLQRIGWVRKHLRKGKQKVRGIVLVEQVPKNLSYTAAAVADTIALKTYRVAVTFDDVEI